jgi:hypothetical protein
VAASLRQEESNVGTIVSFAHGANRLAVDEECLRKWCHNIPCDQCIRSVTYKICRKDTVQDMLCSQVSARERISENGSSR